VTGVPDLVVVPGLGHSTLAALRDLALSPAVEVVTTDIFDTVVWRRVAEPVDAFAIVGDRLREQGALAESLNPWAFGNMRRAAEGEVRRRALEERGTTEITLAEIYGGIPPWVFAGAGRDAGMQEELDTERDLLVADLDVCEILIAAAEAGKTVVAVSDIYFSGDQIRYLLGQDVLGSIPFRHILTSSDHRENKSGKLFDIALDLVGVAPERVVHVGDNEAADIDAPGKRGIRTVLLERRAKEMHALLDAEARFRGPVAALAASEEKLRNLPGADFGLAALRSKMAHRAELAETPSALRAFWQFGAQVYGPLFTGFAEWVAERTEAAGAQKVFPLMREGHFLTELIGGAASPVQAESLWLNRDVCSRAAIGSGTREELEVFLIRRTSPTVADVLRTLGLAPGDVPALAGHAGTRLDDAILRELLLDELTADGPVRERIVASARQLRERLVRYIDSKVADDETLVLCDLGWGATIQSRLAKALEHADRSRRTVGLYMVTHEGAALSAGPHVEIEGFLANLGAPQPVVAIALRSPEVLEQTCMPGHGPQRDIGPDLQPVYDPGGPPTVQHVEAQAVRNGVLAFQREYQRYGLRTPAKLTPLAHGADLLAPILMRSIAAPTAEEAAMFGRWMHDEGSGSAETDSLVDAAWLAKLRHLSPEQLPAVPMNDLYWPWGLARQQDPELAELAAALAAGLITNDATSTAADTGELTIEAIQGVGIEGSPRFHSIPRRNRAGLSFVAHTMKSGSIERVQIRLGQKPVVARLDWLEIRVWAQGASEPIVLRLDEPGGFARLDRVNMLFLAPNLFLSTAAEAVLGFATASVTQAVVYRVDVELGFASMASSVLLPGPGSPAALASAEAQLRQMQESVSWRVTQPLRSLKRLRS
jgi:FMN phosphatase YigB (HAD superfamily)